jgi:hypothetical protein
MCRYELDFFECNNEIFNTKQEFLEIGIDETLCNLDFQTLLNLAW